MKIRVGTFNLFQFVEPPFCWYTKKEKFNNEEWIEKTTWIKKQICEMNCDFIGFQEVFSKDSLKNLLFELGFEYFETIDSCKIDKKNEKIYTSTIVALASKFPIENLKKINVDLSSLKKHYVDGFFKFAREPIKATVTLPNQKNLDIYVCHLKSNRENEFEYVFTKDSTLSEKKEKTKKALEENYSQSLKQRLCEASSLFKDISRTKNPAILMTDLNDKEFSLTIEALTNKKYHNESLKKDDYLLLDAYYYFKKEIYNPHPEQKEIKRTPTSYCAGKGNVLDYIFVSKLFDKNRKNHIGQITSYEVFDKHLQKNHDGSLLNSDHAQVLCELEFI